MTELQFYPDMTMTVYVLSSAIFVVSANLKSSKTNKKKFHLTSGPKCLPTSLST